MPSAGTEEELEGEDTLNKLRRDMNQACMARQVACTCGCPCTACWHECTAQGLARWLLPLVPTLGCYRLAIAPPGVGCPRPPTCTCMECTAIQECWSRRVAGCLALRPGASCALHAQLPLPPTPPHHCPACNPHCDGNQLASLMPLVQGSELASSLKPTPVMESFYLYTFQPLPLTRSIAAHPRCSPIAMRLSMVWSTAGATTFLSGSTRVRVWAVSPSRLQLPVEAWQLLLLLKHPPSIRNVVVVCAHA